MDVDRFFDEAARLQLRRAVEAAEARTIGQIVPVVVERSGHYPAAPLRAAVLGIGLASSAYVLSVVSGGTEGSWQLLALQVAAALVATLLGAFWPWMHRLLAGSELDAAVRARAVRAFYEYELNRTRGQTGVLLFASLFERRVVVLGDRAIHEKMGEVGWNRAVGVLVAGLRSGSPVSGFNDAIREVGARLAEAFPRSGESLGNELGDEIHVEKS